MKETNSLHLADSKDIISDLAQLIKHTSRLLNYKIHNLMERKDPSTVVAYSFAAYALALIAELRKRNNLPSSEQMTKYQEETYSGNAEGFMADDIPNNVKVYEALVEDEGQEISRFLFKVRGAIQFGHIKNYAEQQKFQLRALSQKLWHSQIGVFDFETHSPMYKNEDELGVQIREFFREYGRIRLEYLSISDLLKFKSRLLKFKAEIENSVFNKSKEKIYNKINNDIEFMRKEIVKKEEQLKNELERINKILEIKYEIIQDSSTPLNEKVNANTEIIRLKKELEIEKKYHESEEVRKMKEKILNEPEDEGLKNTLQFLRENADLILQFRRDLSPLLTKFREANHQLDTVDAENLIKKLCCNDGSAEIIINFLEHDSSCSLLKESLLKILENKYDERQKTIREYRDDLAKKRKMGVDVEKKEQILNETAKPLGDEKPQNVENYIKTLKGHVKALQDNEPKMLKNLSFWKRFINKAYEVLGSFFSDNKRVVFKPKLYKNVPLYDLIEKPPEIMKRHTSLSKDGGK